VDLLTVSKDDSLTGKACSPNMYRITTSGGMDSVATTSLLPDLAPKKWAVLATDFLTGHSAAQQFAQQAKRHGKKIVSMQFAPLGTTEFGSYITKIKDSGAEALYVQESGADGVAFVKQAQQFNLFKTVKTVLAFSTISEPVFPAMGNTILGWYDKVNYASTFDNTQNKAFVGEWQKRNGTKPWFIPADNFIGAQFLFQAVRKAKSVDVAKVKAAMNDLSIDTVAGSLRMRPDDHQALRDAFVGQIQQDGDGLGWKIVKSVPAAQTTPKPDEACHL
jgi:branched-chain amino acid transport system substrate-binding protein